MLDQHGPTTLVFSVTRDLRPLSIALRYVSILDYPLGNQLANFYFLNDDIPLNYRTSDGIPILSLPLFVPTLPTLPFKHPTPLIINLNPAWLLSQWDRMIPSFKALLLTAPTITTTITITTGVPDKRILWEGTKTRAQIADRLDYQVRLLLKKLRWRGFGKEH